MNKICGTCSITKDVSAFHKRSRNGTSYRSTCKKCDRERMSAYEKTHRLKRKKYLKKYLAKNRERERMRLKRHYLKKTYNISIEQQEQMFISQEGKCAICNYEFQTPRDMHVDHSHFSGQIRSLLCARCNIGLGYFKDDISTLLKIIQYLQKWKE